MTTKTQEANGKQATPANGHGPRRRKQNRVGSDTRIRILDAAERLFALHGYAGTSLRDVSEATGVNLALSTYYFGTKQSLFDEVVARRAAAIHEQRMQALAQIDPDEPKKAVVAQLIRAYVAPMIEARYGRDPQWSAYVQLIAGLVNSRRWTPVIRKHFDQSAYAFLERLRNALPQASHNDLLDTFTFMDGAMIYVCSKSDRFVRDKNPKAASRKEEMRAVLDNLVRTQRAAFMALEEEA